MRILLVTTVFILVTSGVNFFALSRSFPHVRPRIKTVGVAVALMTAIGLVLWATSIGLGSRELRHYATYFISPVMVSSALVFVTVPFWSIPMAIDRWRRRRNGEDPTPKLTPGVKGRRELLVKAAGAMPTVAAVAGPIGTVSSTLGPVVRQVDVPVADLDARLDGFKILQLTDVHLGFFIGVKQIEKALERAKYLKPDIVVLTGDIADDYAKFPAALKLVADSGARHQALAVLGNHEIYRGRDKAIAHYKNSRVKLLVEDGVVVEHDGARIFIGGCDDPARLGGDHREFLASSIERTMAQCPDNIDAKILLCHRPEGFERGADLGATLTLAGHTHGGQIAILGRSIFGWAAPRSYLLGLYRRGKGHLYTSAGLGHWFPFRLNCPTEAALVTLRKA